MSVVVVDGGCGGRVMVTVAMARATMVVAERHGEVAKRNIGEEGESNNFFSVL